MIGWLQGTIKQYYQRGNRHIALIASGGVGYEVQLVQRDWMTLHLGDEQERWVHQVVSADNLQLFGFSAIEERDLFRELIGVNGVGPQAALALLDALQLSELLRALIHSDLKTLCRAPGVGKRTAERMALELRSRLANTGAPSDTEQVSLESSPRELIATLETLGYETHEIQNALQRLNSIGGPQDGDDDDAWLRACIKLMSG
jgi:Holliday junction DNA helicase RuvA|tara:strand:- start:133 stop:741 length:609 start_codon:yes stop_codon:yes gene_type:complete